MPSPVVQSVAVTTSNAVAISTLTISKPSGTVQGDLLIASIQTITLPVVTPPSGWTLVFSRSQGSAHQVHFYWLIAGASEPSSYDWGFASAVAAGGGIDRITGHDPTTPINAFDSTDSSTLAVTHTAPSVTTTVADTLLIHGCCNDRTEASRSITIPEGDALIHHVSPTSGTVAQHKVSGVNRAAIGATGTADFTFNATRAASVFTVAIAPFVGGGGVSVLPVFMHSYRRRRGV